jgi:hypothetical protein
VSAVRVRVRGPLPLGVALAGALLVAACGATRFEAKPSIPKPLIARIPVVVGVYMSPQFREEVHKEKREGGSYEVVLGKPQSEGFQRLMEAMFTRAVPVTSTDAGARTDPEIRGVLEPVLEDYSFITPRDSGTRLYAVSVKYRINGYTPQGKQFETWTFTGYASVPASNMPSTGGDALQQATSLAMRDAAVKLAVEFRDAAIARGLLPPGAATAPSEVASSPGAGDTPATQSAPSAATTEEKPPAPQAGEPTPAPPGEEKSQAPATQENAPTSNGEETTSPATGDKAPAPQSGGEQPGAGGDASVTPVEKKPGT